MSQNWRRFVRITARRSAVNPPEDDARWYARITENSPTHFANEALYTLVYLYIILPTFIRTPPQRSTMSGY